VGGVFGRRKQKALDRGIGAAVQDVTEAIGRSSVDDYFACVLMSAVSAGGGALSEFMEILRHNAGQGDDVAAFAKRLDHGSDVLPSLRIASWGYVNQVIDLNWRSTASETLDVAIAGLGLHSELEERIAKLDPGEGTVGGAGYQTRLTRRMLGAMVEAVNGAVGDTETDLPSILAWSSAFGENWSLYRITLDQLAPEGPLS